MSFPDFSASDAQTQWQRFCDLLWYHEDLGIWLDISRMHVNPAHLEQLQPEFDKAFAAMAERDAPSETQARLLMQIAQQQKGLALNSLRGSKSSCF